MKLKGSGLKLHRTREHTRISELLDLVRASAYCTTLDASWLYEAKS